VLLVGCRVLFSAWDNSWMKQVKEVFFEVFDMPSVTKQGSCMNIGKSAVHATNLPCYVSHKY
jgi:hypothetical protein